MRARVVCVEVLTSMQGPVFAWDHIPANMFAVALDGTLVGRLVEAAALQHNPTPRVMSALQRLFDISISVKEPAAAVAVAREARSIMFFAITSHYAEGVSGCLSMRDIEPCAHMSCVCSCLLYQACTGRCRRPTMCRSSRSTLCR